MRPFVITIGFSCTDIAFSQKYRYSHIINRNPTYNFESFTVLYCSSGLHGDCIVIPLRTRRSGFQIGLRYRVSLESVSWVSSILQVRTLWAPFHALSDLRFINWLAIWRYKTRYTDWLNKKWYINKQTNVIFRTC